MKIRLVILVGVLVGSIGAVSAQIPVTDAAAVTQLTTMTFQNQKRDLLSKLQHSETLQQWASAIEQARNTLNEAKQIKSNVENLYYLQMDMRRALQQVENIKGFTFADVAFFTKLLVDLDINPVNYVPRIPETNKFISDLNLATGGNQSSRAVYYTYNSMTRFSNGMNSIYSDYSKKTQRDVVVQSNAIKLSLEETKGQLQMEQVITINKKIVKNMTDATTLKRMATDPNIQISEAERTNMNLQANKLMEEAIQLRMDMASLLGNLNSFDGRPITKGLFESSIHSQISRELSYSIYNKIK